VRLPRHSTAGLACKAIPFKHKRPSLLRDATLECRFWRGIEQQVLAGFQIVAIMVSQNLIALFQTQLSNATSPLGDISRDCT
jgi:hypothetical protein